MKRIALIEDDPTVREELALLLENEGYQVLGVTDFAAVPRQVQAFGADLVLLDLGLPGKDGFALCAALRRESPVPIIIVTSRDAALDELKALSLGATTTSPSLTTSPSSWPGLRRSSAGRGRGARWTPSPPGPSPSTSPGAPPPWGARRWS